MAERLNVIIGCEESGVVRDAFRRRGHNAWSCDLRPARDESKYHIQDDVRQAIKWGVPSGVTRAGAIRYDGAHVGWDLGIFHPPCTYLCNSGVRWFTTIPRIQKPGVSYGEARQRAMIDAAALFVDLLTCGIPKIAIENPVMHKHAREAIEDELDERGEDSYLARFAQSVQPYDFGDPEFKRTCLWLRGLPELAIDPDDRLTPPKPGTVGHKEWSQVHRASPGPDRARDRAVTFRGLAEAMADQWGGLVDG